MHACAEERHDEEGGQRTRKQGRRRAMRENKKGARCSREENKKGQPCKKNKNGWVVDYKMYRDSGGGCGG